MRGFAGKVEVIKNNNHYLYIFLVFIFLLFLFQTAYLFEQQFEAVMSIASYLTWHNLFEFTDILISFSVFIVTHFTYERTGRLRSILLGNVFLTSGIITAFHTLSFKGMPDFFIPNTCANRATTFWIVSRLVVSVGFAIASVMPVFGSRKIKTRFFLVPSLLLCAVTFILATYYRQYLPPMYIEGVGLTMTKVVLEYIVIGLLGIAMFRFFLEYRRTLDPRILLLVICLMLNIFSELAFVSYNKVYDIYNYLGHVYKCIAAFLLFRVIFIYNVQKPYVDLAAAQEELKNYAQNLDRLVDQRTTELQRLNKKLLEDLEYARDIQRSMLPVRLPNENDISFHARYFAAERVSGDFYNVFKLDNYNTVIYYGDVSGHGVPAAMLMVFVDQSIKTLKDMEQDYVKLDRPSSVLDYLYKSFNKTNFRDEIYLVMFYGVYNHKTQKLTYCSAGINVNPLVIGTDGSVKEVEVKGFPICKLMDLHPQGYKDQILQIERGQKLFFYTDGLIDAENRLKEQLGEARLKEILSENHHKSAMLLSETITRGVFEFIDTNELKDDITFIVMDVK